MTYSFWEMPKQENNKKNTPRSINNTDIIYISNTDVIYINNTDIIYINNTDVIYISNTDVIIYINIKQYQLQKLILCTNKRMHYWVLQPLETLPSTQTSLKTHQPWNWYTKSIDDIYTGVGAKLNNCLYQVK